MLVCFVYRHACGREYACACVSVSAPSEKRKTRWQDDSGKPKPQPTHTSRPLSPTCHSFGHAPVSWIKFGFSRPSLQTAGWGFNSSCFRSTFASAGSPALIYIAFSTRVSFHGRRKRRTSAAVSLRRPTSRRRRKEDWYRCMYCSQVNIGEFKTSVWGPYKGDALCVFDGEGSPRCEFIFWEKTSFGSPLLRQNVHSICHKRIWLTRKGSFVSATPNTLSLLSTLSL